MLLTQRSDIQDKLRDYFSSSIGKDILTRISDLLKGLPQFNKEVNYLIAGSWAIELISGQKLQHDDIDVITLTEPVFYIDDAITKDEHCDGIMPIPLDYFSRVGAINVVSNEIFDGKIYIPNHNMQICVKLIGQLEQRLPEGAIGQLKILLESHDNFNCTDSLFEIEYILKHLIPQYLDSRFISLLIVNAIRDYREGRVNEAINSLRVAHGIINRSLYGEFEKLALF